MEFRINAETSDKFLPSPGLITAYEPAGGIGVRIDGVAHAGYTVLPHYDSMVAKLIVHGCLLYTSPSPRDATLSRMPSSA